MSYIAAMAKYRDIPSETLRRTEGRARLMRLAEEAKVSMSRESLELERLREYLLMWARSEKSETEMLQCPRAVPYVDSVKGTIDSYAEEKDYDLRLDRWARQILDASIDDLMELPDGAMMRASLRVRYLNEGVSREAGFAIRVFRHRKLASLSLLEADALADRAEIELIPMVKRRGIPL